MKPLIGITMNLDVQATRDLNLLDLDYGKAVLRAGGIPVPILGIDHLIPDLVNHLDGFVFTGGDDIHPRFYKEKPLSGARINLSPDERTRFELKLFKAITRKKKPVLAICHGTQLVNLALGGSIYQDIPLQIPQALKHGPARTNEKVFHSVDILEGTRLSHILGTPGIRTRSSHHQSVKNPGRSLKLSALSHDGVVEALEARGKQFLIAVQWHPEKTSHDQYTHKLFTALIEASKK